MTARDDLSRLEQRTENSNTSKHINITRNICAILFRSVFYNILNLLSERTEKNKVQLVSVYRYSRKTALKAFQIFPIDVYCCAEVAVQSRNECKYEVLKICR